jgi:hypothetical protein
MSRWSGYVWRALLTLGQAEYPIVEDPSGAARLESDRLVECRVDPADATSVDTAFWSIVEREWGFT